jgi:hypothetical protein
MPDATNIRAKHLIVTTIGVFLELADRTKEAFHMNARTTYITGIWGKEGSPRAIINTTEVLDFAGHYLQLRTPRYSIIFAVDNS